MGIGLATLRNLPYQIEIDPDYLGTDTYNLTLSTPVLGTVLDTEGAASNINIPRAGQNAIATFSSRAGRALSLTVDTGSAQPVDLTIRKPDGSVLRTAAVSGISQVALGRSPATGQYTVELDPQQLGTGSYSLQLLLAARIYIDGPGKTSVITTSTDTGQLDFIGSTGQRLSFGLDGTGAPNAVVRVIRSLTLVCSMRANAESCQPPSFGGQIGRAHV